MKKLVAIFLCSFVLVGCTTTASTATSFSLTDVAKHSSTSDCWMAINGSVYDVTSFILRHPGGNEILQGCGKDATQLFNTQGGEGSHSDTAREQLADLKIGVLAN